MQRSVADWDASDLQALINNGVQESLTLDYKRSDALSRQDKVKAELAKDVSAFANSAGGRIVYGIVEENRLPTAIDAGVTDPAITREWLEQTLNSTVQPRIAGLVIKEIHLTEGRAFAIDIPQAVSMAPHQAPDGRYYKRFNFESRPMADYEVRDALRRGETPDLYCEVGWSPCEPVSGGIQTRAAISVSNSAEAPALYSKLMVLVDANAQVNPPPEWSPAGQVLTHVKNGTVLTHAFNRNIAVPSHLPIWKGVDWGMGSFWITFDRTKPFVFGWQFQWPGGAAQRVSLCMPKDGIIVETPLFSGRLQS